MRFIILIAAFVAVLCISSSKAQQDPIPIPDVLIPEQQDDVILDDIEDDVPKIPAVHHFRQKRATCDVLSIFNVNHTACALHCMGHGYRGGYCSNKAVCTCRR